MPFQQYWLATIRISVLFLGVTSAVRADWIETFDSGFDQTWNFAAVDGLGNPSPGGMFSESTAGDLLTMTTTTSPLGGGPAFHFGTVNETFTDVRISALASGVGTEDDVNVLLRGNPATLSAYAFGVDDAPVPGPAPGLVSIARVDNLSYTVLDFVVMPNYAALSDFFLEFSAIGSDLTGTVYSDETRTTVLASLSVMDATYTSGVSGVSVSANNNGDTSLSGTFDNVSVSAVPEPSSIVVLGLGFATAIGMRRRRRRQVN